MTTAITDAERLDRLRLLRSDNVGPVTFRRLLARFGSAAAALDALPDLARRRGSRAPRVCSTAEAAAELDAVAALGAQLAAPGEVGYPPLLEHVEDAPPLLCVAGRTDLFEKPGVAIVGARNATINGRRLARTFAEDLGKAGWLVVSGLARGVDAAAHEGSLGAGTAAVVAGGIDVVYPRENAALYERIRNDGILIAESAPGTEPQARHFPRRNRLISGICFGVVVVEARVRSGSLITARFALEQGREVCAVPGSPLDPRARGANQLIRDGAVLVQSAEDVVAAVGPMAGAVPSPPEAVDIAAGPPAEAADTEASAARDAIVGALGPEPVTVDEVVRSCQFSPAVVATVLLELELAGRVERQPGNRVSLIEIP